MDCSSGPSRSFYLSYREGELGKLPKEVENLTRIAMEGQIAPEMEAVLGLPRAMLFMPEGTASLARPS